MHNSLFIRDLLVESNAKPDRVERRDPHRLVMRDPDAVPVPGGNEFTLSGDWAVACDAPADVARALIDDARDFLGRMGVRVTEGAGGAGQRIEFTIRRAVSGGGLAERDFRLRCEPGRVGVEAGGIAGLWAGLTAMEGEMRARRGPVLPNTTIERRAAWATQISQGPWGGNYSVPDFDPEYLADDSLRLYAHYGVNSMMIYGDLLVYTHGATLPELNHPEAERYLRILGDASKRAARYGVRFSYLVVGPKLRHDHPLFRRLPEVRGAGVPLGGLGFGEAKPEEAPGAMHFLCSSHPFVHRFYEETLGEMLRRAPELAGFMLIVAGESFYHCKMWESRPRAIQCPRCEPRTLEAVVAEQVAVVKRVADRAPESPYFPGPGGKPYVAAWAYSTWGWDRPDRRELVRTLPAGVAIYHHIDKDHLHKKTGYTKHIWDYSIDFNGVSDSLVPVRDAARELPGGRDLFIKTETGIGLEVFQYPYVPAMQHLADKWLRVREQRPVGVQQSWLFFGMFGSRAEELGLWAAYEAGGEASGGTPRDEFLRRIAVRDFGPAAAEHAVRSWAAMSESVKHLPAVTLTTYYVGPSYLGPSHPLVPTRGDAIPDVFHGYLFYLQEGEETFSRKQIEETRTSLVMAELPPTVAHVGITLHFPGAGVKAKTFLDPPFGDAGDAPEGGWGLVADEYAKAAEHAYAAWKHLERGAALTRTEADRRHMAEEMLLTELIYRTNKSCEHVVRFLMARRRREDGDTAAMGHMRRLARAERENAAGATHVYREAPWLDLAERTDGRFSRCEDMIAAKVKWIDEFLAGGPGGGG